LDFEVLTQAFFNLAIKGFSLRARRANHLAQIMSRLVHTFPEERERIEKIAKELDAYEDVKAIIETAGNHPKE